MDKFFTFRILAIILLLPVIIIYGQTYYFDFINLDDNTYILFNPYVHSGFSWESFKWAWTSFSGPYFMPLTWVSYLLDSSIYGINPAGFHITNVILHGMNTLLIFYVLYRLTNKRIESWLVAILFTIHPQRVEAVAWVAERKELLAGFFGLITLAFYVKHIKWTSKQNKNYDNRYCLIAVIFYVFSLLAKPIWITLPFLLLLIDWWPSGRYKYLSVKTIILEKVPFFIVLFLFLFIHLFIVTNTDYAINPLTNISIEQRVENIPIIYITYLYKSIYPFNFTGYETYPLTKFSVWEIYCSFAVLTALILIVVANMSTKPHFLLGGLWFIGTLFPVIGVLGIGESVFITDRWTYLPHIGLFIAFVWGGVLLVTKINKFRPVIIFIVSLLFISYISSSFVQTSYWKNSHTFWAAVLSRDEKNHLAMYMLGKYLGESGDIRKAYELTLQAYQLSPQNPLYALEIGNYLINMDKAEEAWNYYNKLLTIQHNYLKLLLDVGKLAIYHNRFREAESFFNKVINKLSDESIMDKNFYEAHLYLAYAYLNLNKISEANNSINIYISGFRGNDELACANLIHSLSKFNTIPGSKNIMKQLNVCVKND